mmetsp:Transcript_37093/g.118936  ORF Transcript_37093/g.118936 Transcript_37093/m.118936 type:complete len:266 (+) Transcript_37093:163-960(+)
MRCGAAWAEPRRGAGSHRLAGIPAVPLGELRRAAAAERERRRRLLSHLRVARGEGAGSEVRAGAVSGDASLLVVEEPIRRAPDEPPARLGDLSAPQRSVRRDLRGALRLALQVEGHGLARQGRSLQRGLPGRRSPQALRRPLALPRLGPPGDCGGLEENPPQTATPQLLRRRTPLLSSEIPRSQLHGRRPLLQRYRLAGQVSLQRQPHLRPPPRTRLSSTTWASTTSCQKERTSHLRIASALSIVEEPLLVVFLVKFRGCRSLTT